MIYYSFSKLVKDSKQVVEFFKNKQIDSIVALSRGGLSFAQLVSYRLGIRDVFVIRVIGYKNKNMVNNIKILDNPKLDDFKNILLLDDIIDSGRSIKAIFEMIKKDNNTVATASIFYKKDAIFKPDFYLHTTKEWIEFEWESYGD